MAVRTPKQSLNRWQLAIILVAGLFIVALLLTILLAVRRVSPVVDADYYQRGLQYDRERTREARGEQLGWHLTLSQQDHRLRLRLQDGTGRPVTGARGELRIDFPAAIGPLTLVEEGGGWYGVSLPAPGREGVRGRVALGTAEASISQRLAVVP